MSDTPNHSTSKDKPRRLVTAIGKVRRRRPRRHSQRRHWRRQISAFILLTLIAAFATAFWYFTADKRIRLTAARTLQTITGGRVDVQHASWDILSGTRLKGLRIYPPRQAGQVLFEAEDVILEHEPRAILQRRLDLTRIVAYGARLYIRYDRDAGVVNIRELDFLQGASGGGLQPIIELRDGQVGYQEIHGGVASAMAWQRISGELKPDRNDADIYRFHLKSPREKGLFRSSTIEGAYNLRSEKISGTGHFPLELIDLADLPERANQWQRIYEISQPEGKLETYAEHDPRTGPSVTLTLTDGALRVPVPQVHLRLHDVDAAIVFTEKAIHIERLQGLLGDACRLDVSGTVSGYTAEAPVDLSISMTDLDIPAGAWDIAANTDNGRNTDETELQTLAASLPAGLRKFLKDFQPAGLMDVEVAVSRGAGAEAASDINGIVHCRDTSIVYHKFPYPLHHLRGVISLAGPEVTLGPLASRTDDQHIEVAGAIRRRSGRRPLYDITVTCTDGVVDEKLRTALGPFEQSLYDVFQPGGTVNAVYHQQRISDEELTQTLDIDLLDVEFGLPQMDARVTDVAGAIKWSRGGVARFHVDRGELLGARLSLTGHTESLRSVSPHWRCDIEFDNLALDQDNAALLPGGIETLCRRADFSGRIDGRLKLWRDDTAAAGAAFGPITAAADENEADTADDRFSTARLTENIQFDFTAALRQGRLQHESFPYLLQEARGRFRFVPQHLYIDEFQARHGPGTLYLTGRADPNGLIALQGQGRDLPLDDDLRTALGNEGEGLWKRLNPAGRINLDLELTSHPNSDRRDYDARIEWLRGELTPEGFPYPFRDLKGVIHARPDRIDITGLTSRSGATEMQLSGAIIRQRHELVLQSDPNSAEASFQADSAAANYLYDFHATAQGVPLDQRLRDALPAGLQKAYDRAQPEGEVSFDLDLRHDGATDPPGRWNVEGWMGLDDGLVEAPIAMTEINGRVQGAAEFDAGRKHFDFSGVLRSDSLYVKGKRLQDVTSPARYDGGQRRLTLSDVSGAFYDGRLAGAFDAVLTDNAPSYRLAFQILDADLQQFLYRPERPERTRLQGRFDGDVQIAGAAEQQRNGAFNIAIRQAQLGELPAMAAMISILNLSLPQAGALNHADIQGSIVGDTMHLEDIVLHSPSLSLHGEGTLHEPTKELSLVFTTESPQHLANVPFVGSFMNALVNPQLVQVQVTGAVDSPQVEPVALPNVRRALGEFQREDVKDPRAWRAPPPAPAPREPVGGRAN